MPGFCVDIFLLIFYSQVRHALKQEVCVTNGKIQSQDAPLVIGGQADQGENMEQEYFVSSSVSALVLVIALVSIAFIIGDELLR